LFLVLNVLVCKRVASTVGIASDFMLLQTTVMNSDPPSIDHAHIVCHSEGCAEVHAKLKVIQERTIRAKEKLTECARSRAKLESDLQTAATKRAQVEAELQDCADKRKKLSSELAQCGIDRTAAEKGLAQCGAKRATLEAELRQCAENDRPSAEKKLQGCGAELAKLQKQLAEVASKLKGGGAKPSVKSTRRRRRGKSSSLAQTDAEDTVELEATLRAEESRLLSRIEELKTEAKGFGKLFDAINRRTQDASTAMEQVDREEVGFANQVQAEDDRESKLLARFKGLQQRADSAEAKLEDDVDPSRKLKGELTNSNQEVQTAETELIANSLAQAETTRELLMLSLDVQHIRHQDITDTQNQQNSELAVLKEKLATQEKDDHEECDQTRAEVIAAEAKAQETKAALAACLGAKKFIQSKIDAANKASETASKGLEECMARKAKLKLALDECHAKRDRAREKLQECLDRKKILKVKIEECHKARDAARSKLADCFKRKKELKQKIQEASAKLGGSSLLDIEGERSAQLAAMDEALGMLREGNHKFREFLRLDKEHSTKLGELASDVAAHTKEEQKLLDKLEAENDNESATSGGLQALQGDLANIVDNIDIANRDTLEAAAAARASAIAAGGKPGPPPREPNAGKPYKRF